MSKRLLILGAGRGQVPLIKKAKSMGITTIVATHSSKYPGVPIADEICYVDISHPEEVYEKAKHLAVDGIATCCLDTGMSALGYICDRLNLTGLHEITAKMSNDKLLMKEALTKHNVNTAEFVKIDSEESLIEALKHFKFPVILKAVDLQGSRGIYVVNTEEAARIALEKIFAETKKDFCILENFIVGYEFGAEAFVYNNEILFVLPHGKNVYISNTAVPIGHYAPFDENEDIHIKTKKVVTEAINALGLNNCAVNVDLIIKDNEVYVIELTGRVGANCLSEIVSIYYGIDYYEMIIKMALHENPKEIFNNQKTKKIPVAAKMLISENQSGILKEIVNSNNNDDENICDITFFVKHGDEIRKFTNSNDCLAQVIVKGTALEECFKFIDKVIENIKFICE
jgi:Biotin carboxylase